MGAKESSLITLSSLKASDKVRIVTSDGQESALTTVTTLAAAINPLITVADNQNNVRLIATNGSLLSTDEYLEVDCTAADRAILLMDPAEVFDTENSVGQRFYIKGMFSGAVNHLQITSAGGENIDSDPTLDIYGPDDIQIGLQSVGTAWRLVQ